MLIGSRYSCKSLENTILQKAWRETQVPYPSAQNRTTTLTRRRPEPDDGSTLGCPPHRTPLTDVSRVFGVAVGNHCVRYGFTRLYTVTDDHTSQCPVPAVRERDRVRSRGARVWGAQIG